jgi:ABC-2 type transport system ATP-binding protein
MKEKVGKDQFNLDGLNNLEIEGKKVSFLFKGNINLILKKISEMEIINIWIEEPSLEEIFMHYYEKEA